MMERMEVAGLARTPQAMMEMVGLEPPRQEPPGKEETAEEAANRLFLSETSGRGPPPPGVSSEEMAAVRDMAERGPQSRGDDQAEEAVRKTARLEAVARLESRGDDGRSSLGDDDQAVEAVRKTARLEAVAR